MNCKIYYSGLLLTRKLVTFCLGRKGEEWGRAGMRGRKGCKRQRETLKDTFHFLKIKHLLPPKSFSPVL